MKKIILLFSLLMIYTNVYAYENKYFKIDIQETYKLEKEKNYILYSSLRIIIVMPLIEGR